ncbi:unnamed protein product [Linum trigynum]|uniref:mannan endo-1,4-beta-mannosidase n=1 Tax=Linum trigynum TaxID=586398 RepID=A0AAV2E0X3_9ROSI
MAAAVALLWLFLIQQGLMFKYCMVSACSGSIVRTQGTHFARNGRPVYLNGFNAYWMLMAAADASTAKNVTGAFQQASSVGMNVARTWAFNDGAGSYKPLQISPGVYDESVFRGLDFVISEAGRYGIYVILGLVNNYKELGGWPQYVEWAKERGQNVSEDDDFYTNAVVKGYYKNHVQVVVRRVNTITGVAYKDDPTIFAWELMNEPRSNDYSGALLQNWVSEMAAYLKSIDGCHMLEVGLEGFYGESKKDLNPNGLLFGTDFLTNNQVPQIDFATTHLYADQWLHNSTQEEIEAYVDKFLGSHILDSNTLLRKPLVMAEFGKSSKLPGYSLASRDGYFKKIYDSIYTSSQNGGPFCGGIFWQLMEPGMDNWGDGYQLVLQYTPSTAALISLQSHRLSTLSATQKE